MLRTFKKGPFDRGVKVGRVGPTARASVPVPMHMGIGGPGNPSKPPMPSQVTVEKPTMKQVAQKRRRRTKSKGGKRAKC